MLDDAQREKWDSGLKHFLFSTKRTGVCVRLSQINSRYLGMKIHFFQLAQMPCKEKQKQNIRFDEQIMNYIWSLKPKVCHRPVWSTHQHRQSVPSTDNSYISFNRFIKF